jgi:chemotaxis response regulator CheB
VARDQIVRLKPDVMTLDIEMPRTWTASPFFPR